MVKSDAKGLAAASRRLPHEQASLNDQNLASNGSVDQLAALEERLTSMQSEIQAIMSRQQQPGRRKHHVLSDARFVFATSMVIISPYHSQIRLLRKRFMTSFDDEELDDLPEWLDLDFRTVDSYQGAEADIVIISMTRTDEYRFTDDLNRLNLVLTRARQLRIVVGDEELLVGDKQKARDLRAPEMWKRLIDGVP